MIKTLLSLIRLSEIQNSLNFFRGVVQSEVSVMGESESTSKTFLRGKLKVPTQAVADLLAD